MPLIMVVETGTVRYGRSLRTSIAQEQAVTVIKMDGTFAEAML